MKIERIEITGSGEQRYDGTYIKNKTAIAQTVIASVICLVVGLLMGLGA